MSKRVRTSGGGDPARELDELGGVGQQHAGLLVQLAHRGGAMRAVVVALGLLDGAAGKHPHPTHEARGGVALDQQQLEPVGPAAQQDHSGRLPRERGRPGVVLLAGTRALVDGRACSSDDPTGRRADR